LNHGQIGVLILANETTRYRSPIRKSHHYAFGIAHYVAVREDVAVGCEYETRAAAPSRRGVAAAIFYCVIDFEIDDRWANRVDCSDDSLGIGVVEE